jgi:hypothetical protein
MRVLPACLDHTDIVIGEIMDGFMKYVRIWDKIRIQNEEIVAFGGFGAIF